MVCTSKSGRQVLSVVVCIVGKPALNNSLASLKELYLLLSYATYDSVNNITQLSCFIVTACSRTVLHDWEYSVEVLRLVNITETFTILYSCLSFVANYLPVVVLVSQLILSLIYQFRKCKLKIHNFLGSDNVGIILHPKIGCSKLFGDKPALKIYYKQVF